MFITDAVDQVIRQAYIAMTHRPDHALPPAYRQAIYRAFGPRHQPTSASVRGWLALLTARHVLPIWQQEQPHDKMPEQLLIMGERLLFKQQPSTEVGSLVDQAWDWLPSLTPEHWHNPDASNAGSAALIALQEIGGDDCFDHVTIDMHETDSDYLDPKCSDTALWAAAAYAGPIWDRTANPTKQQEFWIWWLRGAVPTAWSITHDHPTYHK